MIQIMFFLFGRKGKEVEYTKIGHAEVIYKEIPANSPACPDMCPTEPVNILSTTKKEVFFPEMFPLNRFIALRHAS